MDAQEWQWVLAHEMAHVRRRDYMVRWLEWLACVCFWWNPVVWWAQRNLRAMEEICCDALVLYSMQPKPHSYANSILTAVESLACPAIRPPAMASEINSGGFLERRFKMIVSEIPKRSNTRWLQACVLLCAMVVLPLGIASAQDYKAVERRLGEAVSKGELSLEQAVVMMDALKKAGGAKKDQGPDRAEAYLMRVKKELGELVEAGEISKEAAARRYEGAEKRVKERMAAGRIERQRGDDKPSEYEGFERRIKAAVREGKMTRVEAVEQLEGFRRRMEMAEQGERGDKRTEYEGFERRIKAAVEAGKMTRAEAREKLAGFRRRMDMAKQGERGERRISREDYGRIEAGLKKAVAEGKISEEDAKARLNGLRRMIAGQGERGERRISREDAGKRGVDWEGIKKRIEGAVKSGDMTREEADAKYKAIRERMAGRRER